MLVIISEETSLRQRLSPIHSTLRGTSRSSRALSPLRAGALGRTGYICRQHAATLRDASARARRLAPAELTPATPFTPDVARPLLGGLAG
jgi:hypothetical protein